MSSRVKNSFRRPIAAFTLACLLGSAPGNNALARQYVESVDKRDQYRPKLKFSKLGGYAVVNTKTGKLVCAGLPNGPLQSFKACDVAIKNEVVALLPKGAEPEVKTAGPFIAMGVGAVACLGGGFMAGAVMEDAEKTIVFDPSTVVSGANSTAMGYAATVPAAKAIVKKAMPKLGVVRAVAAVGGLTAAICLASASAGYGVYYFFFRSRDDIQEQRSE